MFKRVFALACLMGFAAPSVFAEEAYLESDGTQYVLTDYCPTDSMKLVMDYQLTQMVKEQALLGNKHNAGSGASFNVRQNSSGDVGNIEGSFTSASNGDIWSGGLKLADLKRYTLEVDYPAGKFTLTNHDGTSPSSKTKTDARRMGPSVRPLAFFASAPATGRAAPNCAKMRFYSAQAYENGELVHDYVPCKKGVRLGLYDNVTERFFCASSGNAFGYGGDILTLDEDEDAYVELDGTDYIQTNYLPLTNTCVEIDFMLLDTTAQQFLVEAGGGGDKDDLVARIYVNGSKGFSWSFSNKGNFNTFINDGTAQTPAAVGRRMQAMIDGHNRMTRLMSEGVTLVEKEMPTTVTTTASAISAQLRLFYNRFNNILAKGRIYGLKLSEGGVLKRDYVAVRENGVAFLRDTITGQTLYRTNEEPYVASSGSQVVVLDYLPNANSVVEVEVSHLQRVGSRYVFGEGGDLASDALFAWLNNNATDPGVEFNTHKVWSWRQLTGEANLAARHSLIADVPASYVTVRSPTSRRAHTNLAVDHNGYTQDVSTATLPLALFNVNRATIPYSSGAACRIYRATVKENGETLHVYEPYVKNGVVGFRDTMSGSFFAGKLNTGNKTQINTLTCGGAIAREGSAPEAYLESDQTQYIKTDIYPTTKTRVEIDFQLTKIHNDYYIFGSNATPNWELYVNGGYGLSTICHTGWAVQQTLDNWANLERTKMVIDRKANMWNIYRGADKWEPFKSYGAASTTVSTVPFGIFGRQESNGSHYPNSGTTVTGGMTPIRIFSFRVYEDDKLAHDLLPYKDGEVMGLKDTVSGKIYTSTEGNPFVVGGKGYTTASGATAIFETSLAATASVKCNGAKTLGPVYAPGAVKYVWTKDGEVIEGATGSSLDIAWQKTPATATFAVKPVYNVYGTETEGEASACAVEFRRQSFSIILR